MTQEGESKTDMNIQVVIGQYAFWSSSMASDDSNIKYVLVQTEFGERVAECHYSSSSLCEKKNCTYNRGIIIKIIDKRVMIKNLPPVVGEYAYFDSRKTKNTICHWEREDEWLISTDKSNYLGCHYSMKYNMPNRSFVTSHGKITEVLKKIN